MADPDGSGSASGSVGLFLLLLRCWLVGWLALLGWRCLVGFAWLALPSWRCLIVVALLALSRWRCLFDTWLLASRHKATGGKPVVSPEERRAQGVTALAPPTFQSTGWAAEVLRTFNLFPSLIPAHTRDVLGSRFALSYLFQGNR